MLTFLWNGRWPYYSLRHETHRPRDLRSLSNLGNVAPVAAISGSTVSRNIVHGFSLSLSSIICERLIKEREISNKCNIVRGTGNIRSASVKKSSFQVFLIIQCCIGLVETWTQNFAITWGRITLISWCNLGLWVLNFCF